jgi:hypothetical protein
LPRPGDFAAALAGAACFAADADAVAAVLAAAGRPGRFAAGCAAFGVAILDRVRRGDRFAGIAGFAAAGLAAAAGAARPDGREASSRTACIAAAYPAA